MKRDILRDYCVQEKCYFVRGLKTNLLTTICSGWQTNNTTISANFDDFQFFTPILLPNDFMSFGGIFYLNFGSSGEQILNDGLKMLSTCFCPSFNSNLGVTPKFSINPKIVKHLGNKIGTKISILFHNLIHN